MSEIVFDWFKQNGILDSSQNDLECWRTRFGNWSGARDTEQGPSPLEKNIPKIYLTWQGQDATAPQDWEMPSMSGHPPVLPPDISRPIGKSETARPRDSVLPLTSPTTHHPRPSPSPTTTLLFLIKVQDMCIGVAKPSLGDCALASEGHWEKWACILLALSVGSKFCFLPSQKVISLSYNRNGKWGADHRQQTLYSSFPLEFKIWSFTD